MRLVYKPYPLLEAGEYLFLVDIAVFDAFLLISIADFGNKGFLKALRPYTSAMTA
jgi:hypothetical protein